MHLLGILVHKNGDGGGYGDLEVTRKEACKRTPLVQGSRSVHVHAAMQTQRQNM